MSDVSLFDYIEPTRELSGLGAVVGVGHTDYGADYAAARRKDGPTESKSPEALAKTAFERALADAGISAGDVDGLSASFIYGIDSPETAAKALGIQPSYCVQGPGMAAGVLPTAVAALARGECDTLALVYAAASRGIGRQYGGATYSGGGRDSYYYYHPWRWSSQAAHWALMFSYYQQAYGATEADLGAVAVNSRSHAVPNENAIMRMPMTVDDYLASRYIVRPMHLFDMCLVNDGAVCLILRRAERATELQQVPVLVAGWADADVHHSKMHFMVKERLRPQLAEAGQAALDMAGITLADVDHLECYDASTIHLVNQVEGLGFVGAGEGLDFCKDGQMTYGGRIPTNTSGGLLSEAYMHGWNNIVEAVRQLRHQAGHRQVSGAQASIVCPTTTDTAHPVVLVRGEGA